MISQLLATIMMALGVASCTKATSNTFNDAEKPQTKKAVVNNNYDLYFSIVDTYDDTENKKWGYKYYLSETQYPTETPTTNLLLEPYLISNTGYTWSEPGNNIRKSWAIEILKFTNYTSSLQTIEIDTRLSYANTNARYWQSRFVYESTSKDADTLIDKTLTPNTITQLETEISNLDKTTLITQGWFTESQITNDLEVTTPQIVLNENETKYIIIELYASKQNTDDAGWMTLQAINVKGNYIQKQITQEIVDIPGIMFTVLTMPFSFISTAFNLTIFPNTPYQLNFANLFMVILATFILMWLIKKVFH